ncbi:MAG: phosphoribosylamine--glycine ligase [candidate division Zixibacteria bacterium]|nr:phosphoribosylamine--glycine ligase [candidate division Zixibacteria bacterium]
MKILVIGSGGREHAIVWKLSKSKLVDRIFAAPGNAGISGLCKCADIKADNLKGLADFAENNSIDLTVVGSELPLTLGIVDEFESRKLKIFGPSKAASEIEGSKAFSKEFMRKYHIPTASFRIFEDYDEAKKFVTDNDTPLAIKTDGLAAGKGAIICINSKESIRALDRMMVEKVFGSAGAKVVIENILEGEEVTVMAFTDGKTISPMISAQDHKRIFDGGVGPNTGGMGAYAPTKVCNDRMMRAIKDEILIPTVEGLRLEGRQFKGILYAGLMITEIGPKVIEFNCRFGDPETQAVLPLLESDLAEIFLSIIDEELDLEDITWKDESSVCVILASEGYPEKPVINRPIQGLKELRREKCIVFHSCTKREEKGHLLTNGGRVIGITSTHRQLSAAIERAYSAVNKVSFEGMQYRKDIGHVVGGVKSSFF